MHRKIFIVYSFIFFVFGILFLLIIKVHVLLLILVNLDKSILHRINSDLNIVHRILIISLKLINIHEQYPYLYKICL